MIRRRLTRLLLTISAALALCMILAQVVSANDCTHNTYENGFCTACPAYQPAEQINDSNYSTYGFTEDNYEKYKGCYAISNAGQLYWFAEKINTEDAKQVGLRNAVLTADIDLNEGYTFTFIPDFGLVEVKKAGSILGYLGTGIAGDTSGSNSTFDTEASAAGAFYAEATTVAATTTPAGLNSWTPIGKNGSYHYYYTGSFNGQGHTVSGMYINAPDGYDQGLFGYNYGTIQNINVDNAYVCGNQSAGGICGKSHSDSETRSKITGCTNSGTIIGETLIGGICGNARKTEIIGCANSGRIKGADTAGGISGTSAVTCLISECINSGNVNGTQRAGGVCGAAESGEIRDCKNSGIISGDLKTGGVCGDNAAELTNCHNTGDIIGSASMTGGICGSNVSNVTSCYSISSVKGLNSAGGVCGYNFNGAISDCYSKGSKNGAIRIKAMLIKDGSIALLCESILNR